MRKKIAIIGDRNSVLAFKCLGVEVFTPDGKDEIRNTIDTLADEDYGIIWYPATRVRWESGLSA